DGASPRSARARTAGGAAGRRGRHATRKLPLHARRRPADNPARLGQHLQPHPGDMRTFRAARWWGAVGGIALAVVDSLTMVMLGVTFQMNGRDVTALVAVSSGSWFAFLAFLLGYAVEPRARD